MKVPILNTEADTITYHMGIYYDQIAEKPEIRHDIDKHIALINHVNGRYHKALKYVPPGSEKEPMDFETYKDSFVDNIDYLTGVFTKKREKEALSESKKAFRERNAKKSRFV
jgi:hypothetical protein